MISIGTKVQINATGAEACGGYFPVGHDATIVKIVNNMYQLNIHRGLFKPHEFDVIEPAVSHSCTLWVHFKDGSETSVTDIHDESMTFENGILSAEGTENIPALYYFPNVSYWSTVV